MAADEMSLRVKAWAELRYRWPGADKTSFDRGWCAGWNSARKAIDDALEHEIKRSSMSSPEAPAAPKEKPR